MTSNRTWQLHAGVNTDWGDSALRVTFTEYDDTGHEVAHKTWRKHTKALDMAGVDWQAYSALTDLCKMLAEVCGEKLIMDEPDVPLF